MREFRNHALAISKAEQRKIFIGKFTDLRILLDESEIQIPSLYHLLDHHDVSLHEALTIISNRLEILQKSKHLLFIKDLNVKSNDPEFLKFALMLTGLRLRS